MSDTTELHAIQLADDVAVWNASMSQAREVVESAALLAVQSAHLREELPPEPITHEEFADRVLAVHERLHADLLRRRDVSLDAERTA